MMIRSGRCRVASSMPAWPSTASSTSIAAAREPARKHVAIHFVVFDQQKFFHRFVESSSRRDRHSARAAVARARCVSSFPRATLRGRTRLFAGCGSPAHRAGARSSAVMFLAVMTTIGMSRHSGWSRTSPGKLEAVQLRHHQIEQDQRRAGWWRASPALATPSHASMTANSSRSSELRIRSRVVGSSSTTSTVGGVLTRAVFAQHRDEIAALDRLQHVVIDPEREAHLLVVDHRQHHDRDVGNARIAFQAGQHRPAVHRRHHHIEHDDRRLELLRELDALGAALRADGAKAFLLQKAPHQFVHRRVVVDQEHQRLLEHFADVRDRRLRPCAPRPRAWAKRRGRPAASA